MRVTARHALAQSGLAPLDAQVLLAHVLGRERAWLIAHATDPLALDRADAFFALARRRRDGEPVAYLTGVREFWGMELVVTPSVLIPRPETETLVERALARLPADRAQRVLDLGTGSGAIALALARERRMAQLVATDSSAAALIVARTNARRLYLHNVDFVQADWYADLPADDAAYDMIVSNPPYIAAGDRHLSEGDVRFEPMAALVAGSDGLEALRIVVAGAPSRLAPEGYLIVEHGHDQRPRVRELFSAAGFVEVESTRDLSGIHRVMAGRCG
jgi:release factor glutamine methyltransferase